MTDADFVVAWLFLVLASTGLALAILIPGVGALGLALLPSSLRARPSWPPPAQERPERWIRPARRRGKTHRLRGSGTGVHARPRPWVEPPPPGPPPRPEPRAPAPKPPDAPLPADLAMERARREDRRLEDAIEAWRLADLGLGPAQPPPHAMFPCALCGEIHPPLERRLWWWPSGRIPTGGCPPPKPRETDAGG